MCYLDTNILVYLLEATPTFGQRAAELLTKQHAAGEKLVSSALTITEYMAGAKDSDALGLLLAISTVTYVDIGQDIAVLASSLQHKHNLKIGDAIHLATCVQLKCGVFITNDHKLAKVAAKYATVITL